MRVGSLETQFRLEEAKGLVWRVRNDRPRGVRVELSVCWRTSLVPAETYGRGQPAVAEVEKRCRLDVTPWSQRCAIRFASRLIFSTAPTTRKNMLS